MKILKITLIGVLSCLLCSEMYAQDADHPWVLSIGLNSVDNRTAKSVRSSLEDYFGLDDNEMLFGITSFSASRYLNKGFSVAVKTSINEIDEGFGLQDDAEEVFFSVGADLRYDVNKLIGDTGWFDPFISIGANFTSVGNDDDYRVGAGYGFHAWFNETMGLTFESGYNHNFDESANDYFQHSLGLSFRFGGKDADGDGVLDRKDLCPDKAGILEFNGCPDSDGDGIVNADDACPNAAGSIDLEGCPDSDGDGVVDANDTCPNSVGSKRHGGCPDTDGDGVIDKDDLCIREAGPLDNRGCPYPDKDCPDMDTDGDGVLDKNDKCIDQVGSVSNQGCPESIIKATKKIIDFKKSISFDSGKSSFKSGVANELDSVAEIMKTFSGVNFKIKGYTDSVGSTAFNLNLSKARASAVKEYLVSKGVDADRLYDEGFGKERPIASNKTAKNRAMNRRVEIVAIK